MPGGKGMGPAGMGPRTGRAAGFCAGRCGFGRWPGTYSGVRTGYESGLEREYLVKQTNALKSQLAALEKRLAELGRGSKETV